MEDKSVYFTNINRCIIIITFYKPFGIVSWQVWIILVKLWFTNNIYADHRFIIPSPREMKGVYWFRYSVRLSVCPSVLLSVCGKNRVRSVSLTILTGSFHICTSLYTTCNVVFKIPSLTNSLNLWLWLCLALIWDLIWINKMGIHGAAVYLMRAKTALIWNFYEYCLVK